MNLLERLNTNKGLFLAPMEDVTDISFRLICKQFGADMVYTEFVNADGLVRSKKQTKTHLKMRIHPSERPIGIQIYGGNAETMREAAILAEEAEPDVLDINAGCWVKKIAMRGAGAGLLRDIPQLVNMAKMIVNTVRIPVTVKTRLGWDQSSIRIVELAKMLEDVGVQALTIHCRTREQGHSGEADWSWIPKVKEAVSIPVIINGDVISSQDVKHAFDSTDCDAVMIGRAAISNPWIFRDAKHFLATGNLSSPPTLEERVQIALEHLSSAAAYKGERRAVFEMRKYYSGYFRNLENSKQMRILLMKPETLSNVEDVIRSFLDYREVVAA